jgi:hypothetical protein
VGSQRLTLSYGTALESGLLCMIYPPIMKISGTENVFMFSMKDIKYSRIFVSYY